MTLAPAIVGTLVFVVVVILLMAIATAMALGAICLSVRLWQRLLSRMTLPVAGNRILYWPVAVAIVWPLSFALLLQLYQFFWFPVVSEYVFTFAGLGLAAIWVGSVIVACKLMIQWAAARQWRTVLSTLILPLMFLLVLSSSPFVVPFLWTQTDIAATYAKFFINYRYYLAQLEKHPATEPRFVVWASSYGYDEWGVLYDETDEVASGHPSEAWKIKAKELGVICCGHRHITGHFYFVAVEL